MDAFAVFVKVTLPKHLKSLPIPTSFAGLQNLSGDDWRRLLPFLTVLFFLLYATLNLFFGRRRQQIVRGAGHVNYMVDKEKPKVASMVDIEDIGDKAVFCRCWKSSKFPYCDGSHNQHNQKTGDNVGPLIIKKSTKSE